jgi:hypothetical protein
MTHPNYYFTVKAKVFKLQLNTPYYIRWGGGGGIGDNGQYHLGGNEGKERGREKGECTKKKLRGEKKRPFV